MHSKFLSHAILIGVLAVCGSSQAAKPDWAGHGKGKSQPTEQAVAVEIRVGGYFEDSQRRAVSDYYGAQAAKGNCPPGLAKKNNGCMPPGQAKKWARGAPLPSTVIQYPVPRDVVVRIGVPPSGYKYVRVANDILLIAIGTGMVVDAIEDLMR